MYVPNQLWHICTVGADASGADGLEEREVTEVEQDHDSEITEISIGKVSVFLDVSYAEIFLEMCYMCHTLMTA